MGYVSLYFLQTETHYDDASVVSAVTWWPALVGKHFLSHFLISCKCNCRNVYIAVIKALLFPILSRQMEHSPNPLHLFHTCFR